MRVKYDRSCDAAYLYLREIEPAGVARTMTISTEPLLNLDFDAAGQLIGIEAIPASALLPAELLAAPVDRPPPPRVRIQSVEALPGYRLRLGLSDGRTVERTFPDFATMRPGVINGDA